MVLLVKRLDSVGTALVGTVLNFAPERGGKGYGYGYGYGYAPKAGAKITAETPLPAAVSDAQDSTAPVANPDSMDPAAAISTAPPPASDPPLANGGDDARQSPAHSAASANGALTPTTYRPR